MRKVFLTLLAIITCYASFAQNTFPTSGGNVGIGTTSPLTLFNVVVPNAKTTASGSIATFLSTNEVGSAAPFGLRTMIFGAPALSSRYITLQTTDYNLTDGGNIVLQPATGNVGIGTTSPIAQLHIFGPNQITAAMSTGSGLGGALYLQDSGHSMGNGGAVIFGIGQGAFAAIKGFGTNGSFNSQGDLAFSTRAINTDATLTERMRILANGSIGIGTAAPGNYLLAVSGGIHAKQVNIDMTGWSDYVFKPAYHLPSLSEVKTYVDLNHHLPEIPSEKEIVTNGLNLGDIDRLLTKKVEELTLYLIEKDKQLDDEKEIVNQQGSRIDAQEKQLKLQQAQIDLLIKQVATPISTEKSK